MAKVIEKIQTGQTVHLIGSTFFATCSTTAATAAKVALPSTGSASDFTDNELTTGLTVHVFFTYANTATSPTLQVGNSTAKGIKRNGQTTLQPWEAGSVISFTYDGTNWVVNEGDDIMIPMSNGEIDQICNVTYVDPQDTPTRIAMSLAGSMRVTEDTVNKSVTFTETIPRYYYLYNINTECVASNTLNINISSLAFTTDNYILFYNSTANDIAVTLDNVTIGGIAATKIIMYSSGITVAAGSYTEISIVNMPSTLTTIITVSGTMSEVQ